MEEGVLARVIRMFDTCVEGELELTVGTIVQIQRKVDRFWSYGTVCSKSGGCGTFPTDSVIEIPLPPFIVGEQIYVATSGFRGQENGDLTFQKGDLIVGESAVDVNWHRGRINGQSGIFPLNLVWAIDMKNIVKAKESEDVAVNLKARVKMDLKAQLDEELDLKEGDVVTIKQTVDKDWYRGECNGKTGIFPSAFVTIIENGAEEIVLDPPSKNVIPDLLSFAASNGNGFTSLDRHSVPITSKTKQIIENQCTTTFQTSSLASKPHAIALHQFKGEFWNELNFSVGDTIEILRHIDNQWLEGSLNGRVGLFPLCYVKVIVDIPPDLDTEEKNGLVLYDFSAQLDGDVSLSEGERVTVVENVDGDWVRVRTTLGRVGLCPASYVRLVDDGIDSEVDASLQPTSLPIWCDTADVDDILRNVTDTGRYSPRNPPLPPLDSIPSSSFSWSVSRDETDTNTNGYGRYDNCDTITESFNDGGDELNRGVSRSKVAATFRKEMTKRVPPKRPPPIKVSSTSTSDGTRRTPHRPAPPVPLQASRRPHSAAPFVSASSSSSWSCEPRSNSTIRRNMSDVEGKTSSTTSSSEGDNWIVCGTDVEEEPEVILRKNVGRIATVITDSPIPPEERTERNRKKRQLIIAELLQTERDYIRDLQFCYDAFMRNPNEAKSMGIDVSLVFGSVDHLMELSKRFLVSLEQVTRDGSLEERSVGTCFKQIANEMKEVYSNYCTKHEEVLSVLKEYEDNVRIATYFREKLESGPSSAHYFNISSILIKPVQRIMKYPLILNELVKATDDVDPSKKELIVAIQLMTEVASAINECKRKKDLVLKYRKDHEESQSAKLAKLNLHSVMKKSQRIGMRLSSSLGLVSLTKDMAFDEEENKFRVMERAAKAFAKNCETFCTTLQDCIKCQLLLAEDVADLYAERRNHQDVDQFRTVQRTIGSSIWEDFKSAVESRVTEPLAALLRTFEGPNRLIDKRNDKLLDYDSASQRIEKNRDINKSGLLREELQAAKNTYEALNSQLLEELPKLTSLSSLILQDCVSAFTYARKRFVGRITQITFSLMELPQFASCSSDILDDFEEKHSKVIEKLSLISLVPKDFHRSLHQEKPTSRSGTMERRKSVSKPNPNELKASEQSSSQRAYIQSRYPPETIYIVCQQFCPLDRESLELPLNAGDVVAVITRHDPMGRKDRWFVDDGVQKGFVPEKFLSPMLQTTVPIQTSPPPPPYDEGSNQSVQQQQQQQQLEHRYDIVPLEYDGMSQSDYDTSDRYDIVCGDDVEGELLVVNGPQRLTTATVDTKGAFGHEQSNLPSDQQRQRSPIPPLVQPEYYYATYAFGASGPHELSLSHLQVVLVLHKSDLEGNTDWWFVEDRYGNRGYAPANYLVRYQS